MSSSSLSASAAAASAADDDYELADDYCRERGSARLPTQLLAKVLHAYCGCTTRESLRLRLVCREWNDAATSTITTLAFNERQLQSFYPSGGTLLPNVTRYVKHVTALSVTTNALGQFLPFLSRSSATMETLRLTGWTDFRWVGDDLLRGVAACRRLTELRVDGISMVGSRALHLLTSRLLRLRALRLTRCQLGDTGVELLFR